MKHYLLSKTLVLTTVLILGLAISAMANVTVTVATGGTGISADNAANSTSPAGGAWTTLGNIVITEGSAGDFAQTTGKTFLIKAPTGWIFNTGAIVSVSSSGGTNALTGLSASVASGVITITYTASFNSTFTTNVVTISGIQVKASAGSPIPQSGNLTTATGTGSIANINNLNAGALSLTGGAASSLNMTAIPSPQSVGINFSITVTGTDQFGNTASGSVALTTSAGTITPTTATLGTATNVSENTVGTNRTITATAGSAFVTSNQFDVLATATTDYFRSQASGNWGTAATWQSSHDSSAWFTATVAPSSSAKRVTIQGTNNVAIAASITATNIIINSGATLTLNSGLTLNQGTDTALRVSGTLSNATTTAIALSSGALIAINSGGTYIHAVNGGTIPTANWDINSTCEISGATSAAPSGLGQAFGNFTWNSNVVSAGLSLNSNLTNVRGTFTFNPSVSSGSLRLSSANALTLNVGGDFIVNSSASSGTGQAIRFSDGNASPIINISGDLDVQDGILTFDANSTGLTNLNVAGDVNNSGGTFQPNFLGSVAHIIKVTGNWLNSAGDFEGGSSILTINGNWSLTSTSGTFSAGTSTTVGGNWSNSGSSVGFIANTNTVVFNGGSAQTIAGTRGTSFYKLTISNTAGNVKLGIATSVTNALAFTSGKLDASAFSLTYATTATNASAISGVGVNSYVITGNGSASGKLIVNKIASGSAYTLPIGTAIDYLPASITPSTNNLTWSASVYTPATTDATYGSGHNFSGTSLADIVNAVWNITPSTTTTTAIVNLKWTSDLEGSSFSGYNSANIGISHYNGSVWQNSTATGGADNSLNSVTSQFTSFTSAPFGVGSIGNALPITIINFKAVLNSNNSVSLTWQTTVEENSDHFDVERSSDGSHWSSIGTVEAQGNSEIVNNYSYLDASPASGVNYYRLNMIDKNGSHSYTEVKVVNMNAIATFRIFPNPAKDFVNVSLGHVSGNSTIRLFNLGGQTVFTQQLNNESGNTVSIPVQNLSQGTYMLQISGSDGSQHTGQVIIVR